MPPVFLTATVHATCRYVVARLDQSEFPFFALAVKDGNASASTIFLCLNEAELLLDEVRDLVKIFRHRKCRGDLGRAERLELLLDILEKHPAVLSLRENFASGAETPTDPQELRRIAVASLPVQAPLLDPPIRRSNRGERQ